MARVDVLMPQMGESIAEGTLSKWLKKVGDPVKRDEPLFEISTDKVDAEIPAPAAGVLAEIKVQEGHRSLRRHPLSPSPQPLSEAVTVVAYRRPSSASAPSPHRSSAKSPPNTASISRGFRGAATRVA